MVRFSDIEGHDKLIDSLRRAWRAGRLHHAYLLAGPSGVGKRLVARALGALINCEAPTDEADACGVCRSCLKMHGGQHPDWLEVVPDGRFIKIAQIREVASKSRFRPYEGKRRVVLIEPADAMREEAANALLKTLEEPTGETLFVLVSAQRHVLLPTIISRCQPLRARALDEDALIAVLGRLGHEEIDPVLLRFAEGRVGHALELLDSAVFAARAELGSAVFDEASRSAKAAISIAEGWSKERGLLAERFEVLRALLRDAVLRSSGASAARVRNTDQLQRVERLASERTCEQLIGCIEAISAAQRLLDGNVNPRMVLEDLLLTLGGQSPA